MVTKLVLTAMLGVFVAAFTAELVRAKRRRRPAVRALSRVAGNLTSAFREGYEQAETSKTG